MHVTTAPAVTVGEMPIDESFFCVFSLFRTCFHKIIIQKMNCMHYCDPKYYIHSFTATKYSLP